MRYRLIGNSKSSVSVSLNRCPSLCVAAAMNNDLSM